MNKFSCFFGLITLFSMACTSNTIYKKPKDLIPENKMVELLTDVYIANAARNVKTKNHITKVDYIPLIFEKYGIDSIRFHNSNLYYMSRIDDYEAMYKKVEARLKKQLDSVDKLYKKEDSLAIKNKKKYKKLIKEKQ